jgi:hypothetical protein
MPISGLLITLTDDPKASNAAMSELRADPRLVLGDRRGPLLPLVADTPDREEDQSLWRQLNEHDGIVKVDVVFVHIEDEPLAEVEEHCHADK